MLKTPFRVLRSGLGKLAAEAATAEPDEGLGEPQEFAEKGDLNPLLKSLGIRYEGDQVVWSDYNPSHEFRNALPRSIVWTLKEKNGILDAPVTSGVGIVCASAWPGKTYRGAGQEQRAHCQDSPSHPQR